MGTEQPISDISRGHLGDGDESDRMASVARGIHGSGTHRCHQAGVPASLGSVLP